MNQNTQLNNRQLFKTSTFYLAAFLFAKGLKLTGTEPVDDRRFLFVFEDASDREQWINAFNFAPDNAPELLVDSRCFTAAIRALKNVLHQV